MPSWTKNKRCWNWTSQKWHKFDLFTLFFVFVFSLWRFHFFRFGHSIRVGYQFSFDSSSWHTPIKNVYNTPPLFFQYYTSNQELFSLRKQLCSICDAAFLHFIGIIFMIPGKLQYSSKWQNMWEVALYHGLWVTEKLSTKLLLKWSLLLIAF